VNSTIQDKFTLDFPLILAPLGGGPGTPELAAAVSNAGGLGSLGAAYLNLDQLRAAIRKTRSLTKRPFVVNLFAPSAEVSFSEKDVQRAFEATQAYREQLRIQSEPQLKSPFADFDSQIKILIEEKPAAFSFVFGLIPQEAIHKLKSSGIFTMGTATSLDEAFQLERLGVDAIISQGFEAGGHRGIFSPEAIDEEASTLILTKTIAKKVNRPVIASGGIMNGKEIAQAIDAGASACQLGTAFLLADEAGTSAPYRKALIEGNKNTQLTRVFSGRLARGIRNQFIEEMESVHAGILPWPIQNAFTRDIREAATRAGKSEFLSLWAGTGYSKIRSGSALQIVEEMKRDYLKARERA
jgi:nitronate monooxygenase